MEGCGQCVGLDAHAVVGETQLHVGANRLDVQREVAAVRRVVGGVAQQAGQHPHQLHRVAVDADGFRVQFHVQDLMPALDRGPAVVHCRARQRRHVDRAPTWQLGRATFNRLQQRAHGARHVLHLPLDDRHRARQQGFVGAVQARQRCGQAHRCVGIAQFVHHRLEHARAQLPRTVGSIPQRFEAQGCQHQLFIGLHQLRVPALVLGNQLLMGARHPGNPCHWRVTYRVGIEGKATGAVLLGAVHRGVGTADQCRSIFTVVGVDADADAGRHRGLLTWKPTGGAQGCIHLVGNDAGVCGFGHLGQHHQEFVAAVAADGVGLAHQACQAGRHTLQHCVAGRVAKAVVDLLEIVEIQKQHRHALAVPPCAGNGPLQAVQQHGAVGQLGE